MVSFYFLNGEDNESVEIRKADSGGHDEVACMLALAVLCHGVGKPPVTADVILIANDVSFLRHISSIFNMSQPSSSSSFEVLFNTALREYERQTGTSLVDHPFAEQLEKCDSANSIATILQEQSQSFREFRGGDGKLMKSLVCSVDVLYTMSTSTVLGEGVGLVRPKVLICIHCS